MCPKVYSSVTVCLQALHLLVDLLMLVNVCLEVTVLVLPFVIEGAQLILNLSSTSLGELWAKNREPEFLVCSMDIAGLARLVNTDLSRGILYDDLELSITHGRIKQICGGSQVKHILE